MCPELQIAVNADALVGRARGTVLIDDTRSYTKGYTRDRVASRPWSRCWCKICTVWSCHAARLSRCISAHLWKGRSNQSAAALRRLLSVGTLGAVWDVPARRKAAPPRSRYVDAALLSCSHSCVCALPPYSRYVEVALLTWSHSFICLRAQSMARSCLTSHREEALIRVTLCTMQSLRHHQGSSGPFLCSSCKALPAARRSRRYLAFVCRTSLILRSSRSASAFMCWSLLQWPERSVVSMLHLEFKGA